MEYKALTLLKMSLLCYEVTVTVWRDERAHHSAFVPSEGQKEPAGQVLLSSLIKLGSNFQPKSKLMVDSGFVGILSRVIQ